MATQPDRLALAADLVADQRDQIVVKNVFLAVGQILEAAERLLQGIVTQFEPQLGQLLGEGVAAECLPMTSDERCRPTDSGVMIS